ncbi:hypothetical protein ACFL7M_12940 [Thermodesulfobacteriota bacterium]
MSDNDKKSLACIDNMTLEKARRELAFGTFGDPGSPGHSLVLQWVLVKEAEERDARDSETLRIAKEANDIALNEARSASRSARWAMYAAIIATIMAVIAAKADIKWLISWLIDVFP